MIPHINIHIDNLSDFEIAADALIAIAERALTVCEIENAEVSIVINTDEAVQSLNRNYRGVDAPTDVLSFETQNDNDDFVVPGEEHYLGDIVIAAPTANRQAAAMGHTLIEEISLLVVHGILHLLGYDHLTPDEKSKMWALQAQILTHHGLAHVKPTEAI